MNWNFNVWINSDTEFADHKTRAQQIITLMHSDQTMFVIRLWIDNFDGSELWVESKLRVNEMKINQQRSFELYVMSQSMLTGNHSIFIVQYIESIKYVHSVSCSLAPLTCSHTHNHVSTDQHFRLHYLQTFIVITLASVYFIGITQRTYQF